MALLMMALGAVGHMVLWVALINRVHSLGIARFWIKFITAVIVVVLALGPVAVAAALAAEYWRVESDFAPNSGTAAWVYVNMCAGLSVVSALHRLYLWRHPERAAIPFGNHTAPLILGHRSGELAARGMPTLLTRLPGNQVLSIHVESKDIFVPRLSAAHDGLRIAHLSDLHMSGRIAPAFFEHVVDVINEALPDIVAVTGDIVEGDAYIDWLSTTLGRLQARYGVYYVLGNHDRRANEAKLKAKLAECGLVHVGGDWRQFHIQDAPVIVAGNELPWYHPAADLSGCPTSASTERPLRILLAHSPDQFKWAQANDIDLMMAGHLHGGQVRLPLVGAITSPSAFGVRYAAGVFRAGNTVLHVSRGVGALTPLRLNCPPEIALLTLCATAGKRGEAT